MAYVVHRNCVFVIILQKKVPEQLGEVVYFTAGSENTQCEVQYLLQPQSKVIFSKNVKG